LLLKRDLRKNLAKSTEKEKTGEAIHRTPYGQSCADEERTQSELGFPTHTRFVSLHKNHTNKETKIVAVNQRKELACKRSTRAAPCCCAGCCCSKLFRVQRLLHKRDGCRPQLRTAGRTWALRAVQGQHLHLRQVVLPVMQSSGTSAALGVTPPNTWQLLKPEPEASLRQESRTKKTSAYCLRA